MKKATILSFILATFVLPFGCASLWQGVAVSTAFLRGAGNTLGTIVLQKAVSADDRVDKANMVYAAAHALRTLVNPTEEEVKKVLLQWLPDKAHWEILADGVARYWSRFEESWRGDARTATNALEQLALGFEDAANAIINKP